MKKLTGKVAIVTGSSRGIGRAIAEQLAELGADVVINYASSPDKAEQVADIARQKGVRAITVQADLARKDDVERLFSQTMSELGKVDILINNAGIMKTTPLADVTEEEFDQQFAINVKGTKGAVEQITRQLAKEFGSRQITINAVAPGPVNTELFSAGKTEQQLEGMRKMNAFGRLGEPEDIANVISFLVSAESQWVTGQTLRANGGFI
ncbi:hypothetical protein G195_008909 [Phytophthora kernoviae 00238/432]|uniref:Uncharacterized protein n=1 Tax=Phytophthora kernoviae 00238/432 TaxID=1284355 RepID=A0A8J4SAC4_9STRA|nr:hypothetical protein G195_008909 [Phytophthora kernoviae 00238/432]